MQTFSEENYLKIIFKLEGQGIKKITPTAIAEALNNNPASVIDMLKKLGEKKLISYEKSKGVKLTTNGKTIALTIIRKHRLWEVFLFEKLGYEWDQVHDMAEQLEHIAGGFDIIIDSALGEGFAKLPDICNPGGRIISTRPKEVYETFST